MYSRNPISQVLRDFASKKDYVLVVGACHIDVIGDHPASGNLDKPGDVSYAIGGTAFNIAVNLGQVGIPTAILTVLKQNSFSSVWSEERLKAAEVITDFVEYTNNVKESGFIGIRCMGELETAVTATAISSHALSSKNLEQAIRNCRFVVCDCNLSKDQLINIFQITTKHQKPLSIAGTSDSKASRVLSLPSKARLLVLNEKEFTTTTGSRFTPIITSELVIDICNRLRAQSVVITRGAFGYDFLQDTGEHSSHAAPDVEAVKSTSGAGDALLSGILKYWFENQDISISKAGNDIASIVTKVLGQEGATIGALASDTDFSRLAKIANKRQSIWKRLFSQEVGVATAIVTLIYTLILYNK